MDKLKEKIGSAMVYLIGALCAIAFVVVGVLNCLDIVLKILTIAGWGSWQRGIVAAPFFVVGAIQIIRGFVAVFTKDAEQLERKYSRKKNGHLLLGLYLVVTMAGYFAVAAAILFR